MNRNGAIDVAMEQFHESHQLIPFHSGEKRPLMFFLPMDNSCCGGCCSGCCSGCSRSTPRTTTQEREFVQFRSGQGSATIVGCNSSSNSSSIRSHCGSLLVALGTIDAMQNARDRAHKQVGGVFVISGSSSGGGQFHFLLLLHPRRRWWRMRLREG